MFEDGRPVVLLVDDDEFQLQMFGHALEENGFVVNTESDPEKAFSFLKRCWRSVDVIVTDIMMAKLDGWALLDKIRNELFLNETEMPVLVMSAFESDDLAIKAHIHKANAWLSKGASRPIKQLVNKVKFWSGDASDASSPDGAAVADREGRTGGAPN